MKKLKNTQDGIALVALVITIIVLVMFISICVKVISDKCFNENYNNVNNIQGNKTSSTIIIL